jgi:hypothetical protein
MVCKLMPGRYNDFYITKYDYTNSIFHLQLIGDLASMHIRHRPVQDEMWSAGFCYGIAAAGLYMILTVCLIANLIGYIRGKSSCLR